MRSVVSSFGDIGDLDVVNEPVSGGKARRVHQRRQFLAMIAISYVVDAALLSLCAYANTIPLNIPAIYFAVTLGSLACFSALAETRISDRAFVVSQMCVSLAFALTFAYAVPQIGCLFLCSLFVVFSISSLRATLSQTAVAWVFLAIGLAYLFMFTNKPIGMPRGTPIERFAMMMMFTVTVGRCMMVGVFSSAVRQSFYSQGLALKEAYMRIEELAELDELTGAHNRRSIMRTLDEEIERAIRGKAPCSVALIDLDWFKKINDRFGHPTGDEVLRTFAITMFANIRSIDKFGRYGGEEFLLILPDTGHEAAARTIDRLRVIVAGIDWSSISHGLEVTLSAGVATLRTDENADGVLGRADIALYQAKKLGRNRIHRA